MNDGLREYHLVRFDSSEILFTSEGYLDQVPFDQMKLFHFSNEETGFHILHISDDFVLLFGKDVLFQEWLLANGVKLESHRIRYYKVREKMKNMEALLCTTEDDLIVEMTSSYLKDWCSGTIKTKEEEPKLIYSFDIGEGGFLPMLNRLHMVKPELIWSEKEEAPGVLPEKISAYREKMLQKEKADSVKSILYVILVFLVIAYMVYSCFTAELD